MSQFSAKEKFMCALREVALRRKVYPRLIQSEQLRPDLAEREIAIMQEIASEYGTLAEKENPQPSLFGEGGP